MRHKIFIAIANYNRQKIAQSCIYTLWKAKHANDRMCIYDDGTTEYDFNRLLMDRCDEIVASPRNLGIHVQRREHIRDFVRNRNEFTHLYLTDSDAAHDEKWRQKALDLFEKHKKPVSLFNSAMHAHETISDHGDCYLRQYNPGISVLIDRNMAKTIDDVTDAVFYRTAWDYSITDILRMPCITSKISYVEHFGAGGMHNNDFERDRATEPTKWLKSKRVSFLRKFSTTQSL